MSDYPVVITSSDGYWPTVKVMTWLIQKHWKPAPRVIVGGFSDPPFDLPKKWSFFSCGKQEDYPLSKWSDAVIKLLEGIGEEVALLMLDDMWPVRGVDTRALDVAYGWMHQFKNVAKFELGADRLYAHGCDLHYARCAHLDIIKSMPGSPYHLSTMPGFWRVEHLLSVMVPGESPWDLELQGTTRLAHRSDLDVLGTRQWPLKVTLGHRGGDSKGLLLDEITPAEVDAMQAGGYFDRWGRESRQTD